MQFLAFPKAGMMPYDQDRNWSVRETCRRGFMGGHDKDVQLPRLAGKSSYAAFALESVTQL
jgi:hypothetical protein